MWLPLGPQGQLLPCGPSPESTVWGRNAAEMRVHPPQGDWPKELGLPAHLWPGRDGMPRIPSLSKPVPTQATQHSGKLLVCRNLGQTTCDLSESSLGEVTHTRQLLAQRVSAQASWSDPQLYTKTPLLTWVMWSPPAQQKHYLQTKSHPS